MEEDYDDIPIGIVLSMISYSVYIYILNILMRTFKIYEWIPIFGMDNIIMFIIYMVPLILLYTNAPIVLRRYYKRK